MTVGETPEIPLLGMGLSVVQFEGWGFSLSGKGLPHSIGYSTKIQICSASRIAASQFRSRKRPAAEL